MVAEVQVHVVKGEELADALRGGSTVEEREFYKVAADVWLKPAGISNVEARQTINVDAAGRSGLLVMLAVFLELLLEVTLDRRGITGVGSNGSRKDIGGVRQEVERPGHVAGAIIEHEHPVWRWNRESMDHVLAES